MKEKIFFYLILILAIFFFIYSVEGDQLDRVFYSLLNQKKTNHKIVNDQQKYPPYIKGVYLSSWTAGNENRVEYFINLAKNTEINAVVIDLKEVNGIVAFNSSSEMINDLKTELKIIPDLRKVVQKFHQHDIYTIARIVVFKDDLLPKIKPQWALKNIWGSIWRDYSGTPWLDPSRKQVWDYHLEIAKQAVEAGFDEINFDYVRFPSDGNISQIDYPKMYSDDRQLLTRAEIMREFFKYIDQQLSDYNVFLSADLFGLTLWRENNDDMNIGQILEYAAPHFDIICPMIYPSHYGERFENYQNPAEFPYEIVKMNLEKGKQRIANTECRIRPWLQDFDMGAVYDQEKIELQKQAVYDADAYGWLLWNPANRYTEQALERK